ncbi:MAG: hypothetical protein RLZZ612_2034 [Pseudomonadota bacterium]|jgi:prepilin-type N-terminal cleavage/methylation domain-containing protein
MQRQQGFTLLEMLLVLVIAALIAGLSLVSVQSLLAYSERKTQADRFDALVKDAPRLAAKRLCWTQLRLDPKKRVLSVWACGEPVHEMEWMDGMDIVVGQPVSATLNAGATPSNVAQAQRVIDIWFSPKANTPGAILTLKSGEQVLREVDLRPLMN